MSSSLGRIGLEPSTNVTQKSKLSHKVVLWFTTIRPEVANPLILFENTYNVDETTVLMLLKALKVLVQALVSSEEIS